MYISPAEAADRVRLTEVLETLLAPLLILIEGELGAASSWVIEALTQFVALPI
jgi:hypothetical protein